MILPQPEKKGSSVQERNYLEYKQPGKITGRCSIFCKFQSCYLKIFSLVENYGTVGISVGVSTGVSVGGTFVSVGISVGGTLVSVGVSVAGTFVSVGRSVGVGVSVCVGVKVWVKVRVLVNAPGGLVSVGFRVLCGVDLRVGVGVGVAVLLVVVLGDFVLVEKKGVQVGFNIRVAMADDSVGVGIEGAVCVSDTGDITRSALGRKSLEEMSGQRNTTMTISSIARTPDKILTTVLFFNPSSRAMLRLSVKWRKMVKLFRAGYLRVYT